MDKNKKPRICEVLGVEPLEEWTICGTSPSHTYRINSRGRREYLAGTQWEMSCNEAKLVELVENPDLIQRKPRWTQEDIEDAKAVRKLFPTAINIHRSEANDTTKITYLHPCGDCPNHIWYSYVDGLVCPSLKPGEDAKVDEILEAEV